MSAVAEGFEDAEEEVGGDVEGVAVHDGGDAGARGGGEAVIDFGGCGGSGFSPVAIPENSCG
jgi:hypothetical protein